MSGPAQVAQQVQRHVKDVGDVASVATLVGTLADFLPAVAAVFTIIWTAIRIWETDTVQGWWRSRRKKGNGA